MLQSHISHTIPQHILEEFIWRQTFALEKLQRDGAYACEIRAAKRRLRCFEAKLQARRARLETRCSLKEGSQPATTSSRQGSAEQRHATAAVMGGGRPSWAGHAATRQEI